MALTHSLALAANVDLQITKTGPSSAFGGDNFTYVLEIVNNGPSDASGATFDDPMPSGVTNVTAQCISASNGAACPNALNISDVDVNGTIGTLPNLGKVQIQIQGRFPIAGSSSITNTATVTPPGNLTETDPSTNTSTVSTSMTYTADLKVTKTQSSDTYQSGASVTYEATFTNSGPSAADGGAISDYVYFYNSAGFGTVSTEFVSCTASGGAVCPDSSQFLNQTFTDPFSVGIFYSNVPTWPSGGTIKIVYKMTHTRRSMPCGRTEGSIVNNVNAFPPNGVSDPDYSSNDFSISQTTPPSPACPQADIQVTKTQSSDTYQSGIPVTYTLTFANLGPNSADGGSISDFTRFYNSAGYGLISTEFVSCSATGGAICPDNSQFLNQTNTNAFNLEVFFTTIPTWPSGGVVTIVYKMTHTRGDMPCGLPAGNIENMGSTYPPNGTDDPDYGNNNAYTNQATLAGPACPPADIQTTKTQSRDVYQAGVPVTYEATFTNAGPSAADGGSITDYATFNSSAVIATVTAKFVSCTASNGAVCPDNTEFKNQTFTNPINATFFYTTVPTWPAGGSIKVVYEMTHNPTLSNCIDATGTIQNNAFGYVPNGTTETDLSNNTAFVKQQFICADISVNKSVTPSSGVLSGQALTFTVKVINGGPGDAADVAFSDPLPSGFIYSNATCEFTSAPIGTCGAVNYDPAAHKVSSSIASLPSGATALFTITGTAGYTIPGSYPNTAEAYLPALGYVDPVLTSNVSQVNFQLTNTFSPITVTKTLSGGPSGGLPSALTFTGTITCGAQIPQNWTVTIPAGATSASSGTPLNFFDRDTCTVTEDAPPTAPTNYAWSGTPVITPNPTPALGPSTPLSVSVTNTLVRAFGNLTIQKNISGGPPSGISGQFGFVVDCGADGSYNTTITLSNATSGVSTVANIPAGAICMVSESSPLPTSPPNYTWGALPAAQSITIGASGNTVSFTNTLTAQTASLTLNKVVKDGPAAGISGAFQFAVNCGSSGSFTGTVTVSAATSGSTTLANIPQGAVCSVSEQTPLPTPPNGYAWGSLPAAQSITIGASNNALSFTNTLTSSPYEVDPPAITKLGTLSNLVTHEVTWSIKVTNDGANNVSLPALPVEITDPVPNQSQFVSGSITCVASNGAVVISQCVFDNPSNPTTVLVKAELPYGTSVTVKVKSLTADNVPSVLNTAFVNYTDKGQAASASAMSDVPLNPVEKIPAQSPLALLMLAWLIAGGAFWQMRHRR